MLATEARELKQLRDEQTKLRRPVADLSMDKVMLQDVVQCDNGSHFVSAAMDLWAYFNGFILDFCRRGKPTDSAAMEPFDGQFREECVNVHCFASIEEAQRKTDGFWWDYNEYHPHQGLQVLSPREFAKRLLTTAADSPSLVERRAEALHD